MLSKPYHKIDIKLISNIHTNNKMKIYAIKIP